MSTTVSQRCPSPSKQQQQQQQQQQQHGWCGYSPEADLSHASREAGLLESITHGAENTRKYNPKPVPDDKVPQQKPRQ
jgi:hypothetical protein